MRWGIRRKTFQVEPGLYELGNPDADSPVLLSANYRLSFDLLRRALSGRDAWILVLDTVGVNVWCAAGKGTFGTDELLARIAASDLEGLVRHRVIVAPQLGATGIAAHEVLRRSGFEVVFGPVRAVDLPAFLDAGRRASPEMRTVTFSLSERAVLVPVELVQSLPWTLPLLVVLVALGGLRGGGVSAAAALASAPAAAAAVAGSVLAGAALVPLLLPWIPGRPFSAKGAILGLAWAAAAVAYVLPPGGPVAAAGWLLVLPALSAFLAMNFTGSSVITSLSGVRREMRFAVPAQAAAAIVGLVLIAAGAVAGRGP